MSEQAKAEQLAREKVAEAINSLRTGQTILHWAGWDHDPFAALIDEAKNIFASLRDYAKTAEAKSP